MNENNHVIFFSTKEERIGMVFYYNQEYYYKTETIHFYMYLIDLSYKLNKAYY